MPCNAHGNHKPVITWYKDSNSCNLNHRIFTDAESTLRINDLSLEDAGMYECVASSHSGKYVWRNFLSVLPPFERQESNNTNLKSVNYEPNPNTEFVRSSPMKPYIVKVDSTTVTIAWHPKYSQSNTEPQHDLEPDQGSSHAQVAGDPRFRMPRSVKPKSFSSDRMFQKGAKNKRSRIETHFKFLEAEIFENPETNKEDVKIDDMKAKNLENEETDEGDDEYVDEERRFDAVTEKLSEGEYEEEEESNHNGNNLIIQSRPPTNSSKTRPSDDNTKNGAILLKTSPHPITDFQSTFLPPIPPAPFPLPLNPSNSIKKSQITFNIEYYSAQEDKSEWLLGATVTVETATLKYLKPNAEYIFFVRSVSVDGVVSPPSPLSNPVQTSILSSRQSDEGDVRKARSHLGSPVVVLLQTAYATSSTPIRLEWQIVTVSDFIEGFYIYFRPDAPTTVKQAENERDHEERYIGYQMLTVLNTEALNFQIRGLEKFKTYQIFLISFYKNVDGTPSNYINVTTDEDVPSLPPEILNISPVNASAMVVRWKPPSTKYHHGILLGYQVRLWSASALVGNLTTNAETTSVALNNLTPGQSYSLQIGAFTIKGIGTFSSMKTFNFTADGYLKTSLSGGYNNQTKHFKVESKDNKNLNEVSLYPVFRSPGRGLSHDDVSNKFLTEAWFITLIGSVIFLMLLVFVFALYMRRYQLRKEMAKFKVSNAEIPDGSTPPCYSDDNLWIDSRQSKQLSHKCVKANDLNEYENGNNYAVVQDQHSPIAYATTTLVNREKHKSNFAVFGDSDIRLGSPSEENAGVLGSYLQSRSNAFRWSSNIGTSSSASVGPPPPTNNKTGSLITCSHVLKKDPSTGPSLNVLSTFQTPLPGRKEIVVDFCNSGQHLVKSSILKHHEPRLNRHSQILQQHPEVKNFNCSPCKAHNG